MVLSFSSLKRDRIICIVFNETIMAFNLVSVHILHRKVFPKTSSLKDYQLTPYVYILSQRTRVHISHAWLDIVGQLHGFGRTD